MLINHKPDCPKHLAQLQHRFKVKGSGIVKIYRVMCPNCEEMRPIEIEEWNSIDRLATALTLVNDISA